MGSVLVPPRVAAALAMQNLVHAILQFIAYEPDPKKAGAQTTRAKPITHHDVKAAFEKLGVPVQVRDAVMKQLLVDKLVRTDGTRVWVGEQSDLRAYLARRNLAGVTA